jgi:malonate transporter and related proteins
VFNSLSPVFLLIATGYLSRVGGLVEANAWTGIERLTYFVLFPAVIVQTLVGADLSSVPLLGVGGALIGAILANALVLLLLRPLLKQSLGLDGPGFTSLFQASTRWNTFVGLAVAGSLFGPRGITLIAVAIAAMVPLLNVLALGVLMRYAGGRALNVAQVIRTLAVNPFIWSPAVGLTLNLAAVKPPQAVMGYVDTLGRASLAAGLLVVGAALDLRRLARPRAVHALSMALKLVALPVVAATLASRFGVGALDLAVTVTASSVPTSSAAYVLAKQMGGDAQLMAEMITLQTLAAFLTMPVAIWAAQTL